MCWPNSCKYGYCKQILRWRNKMIKIRRILFPTDFSRCANQALAHAIYLASKYQAELHVLHGIVLHYDDSSLATNIIRGREKFFNQVEIFTRDRMSDDLTNFDIKGLSVKLVQKRGISAAPVILDYTIENNIDLIVMGTHGRRGLGHLFLGGVTEEVVRHARCPVFTIREQKNPIDIHALKRILVPADFSDHCKSALIHAKEIADTYDAKIELLHVYEERVYPPFFASDKVSMFEFQPDLKSKIRKSLIKFFKETVGQEEEVRVKVLEGHAARDIVRYADKKNTDLIVIATHGLTGIKHLLVGSVTEKVVRMASCPVFVVRTFGKSLIQSNAENLLDKY